MANTILLKKSSTAAAQPTAGQLSAGELAINTADGRLFAKNSAGTVVNLPVTSISGQTITPNTVGVNVASPTSKLHVKHSEIANGTDSVAKLLSASTTTTSDTEWKGRTLLGAQNLTFLVGCFNSMAAIGAHSWTSADSQTGAAWADMYFNPDGAAKIYLGAVPNAGWTPNQGILCVDNSSGKVGMGTNSPQANFQMVIGYDESFDNADPPNAVYTAATSTLAGAAQTEILQVIHGGHEYDTNSESYVLNEYINLARFHVNNAGSRGSFSLSNSGTGGAWQDNVLQFFIHGSSYGPGYYGGNACDAGCAMIVTQGSDIQKLQIGNLTAAPIEFFTGNTKRFRIRQSDGNYDLYSYVENDYTAGPAFVWNNRYDSENNYSGEVAAIQMVTGTAPDEGTLAFYTGQANSIVERVRIDGSGNVGIGVTTPTVKLDVDGAINCTEAVVQGRLQSPQTALYLWENFR